MDRYVVDTMALILRLERRKMPARARSVIEESEAGRATLLVPAIVFAELGYLAEKGRIDTNLQEAHQYLLRYPCISEHPLTFRTVEAAFSIHDVPELHDRLIAGSAHELGIPVITNDPAMEQSSQVTTLWR
jgi:predicted nucleic acid-binding protein